MPDDATFDPAAASPPPAVALSPSSSGRQLRRPFTIATYFLVTGLDWDSIVEGQTISQLDLLGPCACDLPLKVTDRYPLQDYVDTKADLSLTDFCFPTGPLLSTNDELCDQTSFHFFTMTSETHSRMHGTCLSFFEPIDKQVLDALPATSMQHILSAPVDSWLFQQCGEFLSAREAYSVLFTFLKDLMRIVDVQKLQHNAFEAQAETVNSEDVSPETTPNMDASASASASGAEGDFNMLTSSQAKDCFVLVQAFFGDNGPLRANLDAELTKNVDEVLRDASSPRSKDPAVSDEIKEPPSDDPKPTDGNVDALEESESHESEAGAGAKAEDPKAEADAEGHDEGEGDSGGDETRLDQNPVEAGTSISEAVTATTTTAGTVNATSESEVLERASKKAILAMCRTLYDKVCTMLAPGVESFLSEQRGLVDHLVVERCLLLLSPFEYFELFQNLLFELFSIVKEQRPIPVPIERCIQHIVCEIPEPPPGKLRVCFKLYDSARGFRCSKPPLNCLPLLDIPLRTMFECLSPQKLLTLFSCAILEYRIVLVSKRLVLLGQVAKGLCALLFPLVWQSPYIPVMPSSMLNFIHAPFPFIFGIHKSAVAQGQISNEGFVFVDLDEDIVELPQGDNLPQPPPDSLNKLVKALRKQVYGDKLFDKRERLPMSQSHGVHHEEEEALSSSSMETGGGATSTSVGVQSRWSRNSGIRASATRSTLPMRNRGRRGNNGGDSAYGALYNCSMEEFNKQVREIFLRFFVHLLQNYRRHMGGMEVEEGSLFDKEGFVASHPESAAASEFLTRLVYTQMMQMFFEDRIFAADRNFEVMFFDAWIDKEVGAATGSSDKTKFLDDSSQATLNDHEVAPPTSAEFGGAGPFRSSCSTFPVKLQWKTLPRPKVITRLHKVRRGSHLLRDANKVTHVLESVYLQFYTKNRVFHAQFEFVKNQAVSGLTDLTQLLKMAQEIVRACKTFRGKIRLICEPSGRNNKTERFTGLTDPDHFMRVELWPALIRSTATWSTAFDTLAKSMEQKVCTPLEELIRGTSNRKEILERGGSTWFQQIVSTKAQVEEVKAKKEEADRVADQCKQDFKQLEETLKTQAQTPQKEKEKGKQHRKHKQSQKEKEQMSKSDSAVVAKDAENGVASATSEPAMNAEGKLRSDAADGLKEKDSRRGKRLALAQSLSSIYGIVSGSGEDGDTHRHPASHEISQYHANRKKLRSLAQKKVAASRRAEEYRLQFAERVASLSRELTNFTESLSEILKDFRKDENKRIYEVQKLLHSMVVLCIDCLMTLSSSLKQTLGKVIMAGLSQRNLEIAVADNGTEQVVQDGAQVAKAESCEGDQAEGGAPSSPRPAKSEGSKGDENGAEQPVVAAAVAKDEDSGTFDFDFWVEKFMNAESLYKSLYEFGATRQQATEQLSVKLKSLGSAVQFGYGTAGSGTSLQRALTQVRDVFVAFGSMLEESSQAMWKNVVAPTVEIKDMLRATYSNEKRTRQQLMNDNLQASKASRRAKSHLARETEIMEICTQEIAKALQEKRDLTAKMESSNKDEPEASSSKLQMAFGSDPVSRNNKNLERLASKAKACADDKVEAQRQFDLAFKAEEKVKLLYDDAMKVSQTKFKKVEKNRIAKSINGLEDHVLAEKDTFARVQRAMEDTQDVISMIDSESDLRLHEELDRRTEQYTRTALRVFNRHPSFQEVANPNDFERANANGTANPTQDDDPKVGLRESSNQVSGMDLLQHFPSSANIDIGDGSRNFTPVQPTKPVLSEEVVYSFAKQMWFGFSTVLERFKAYKDRLKSLQHYTKNLEGCYLDTFQTFMKLAKKIDVQQRKRNGSMEDPMDVWLARTQASLEAEGRMYKEASQSCLQISTRARTLKREIKDVIAVHFKRKQELDKNLTESNLALEEARNDQLKKQEMKNEAEAKQFEKKILFTLRNDEEVAKRQLQEAERQLVRMRGIFDDCMSQILHRMQTNQLEHIFGCAELLNSFVKMQARLAKGWHSSPYIAEMPSSLSENAEPVFIEGDVDAVVDRATLDTLENDFFSLNMSSTARRAAPKATGDTRSRPINCAEVEANLTRTRSACDLLLDVLPEKEATEGEMNLKIQNLLGKFPLMAPALVRKKERKTRFVNGKRRSDPLKAPTSPQQPKAEPVLEWMQCTLNEWVSKGADAASARTAAISEVSTFYNTSAVVSENWKEHCEYTSRTVASASTSMVLQIRQLRDLVQSKLREIKKIRTTLVHDLQKWGTKVDNAKLRKSKKVERLLQQEGSRERRNRFTGETGEARKSRKIEAALRKVRAADEYLEISKGRLEEVNAHTKEEAAKIWRIYDKVEYQRYALLRSIMKTASLSRTTLAKNLVLLSERSADHIELIDPHADVQQFIEHNHKGLVKPDKVEEACIVLNNLEPTPPTAESPAKSKESAS